MAQVTHLALRRPKLGTLNFAGVVLPYKPPIDKVAAIYFLQSRNANDLEEVRYWTSNECPPEQFAAWRDERLYPVDIGNRKYHTAGVRSASEFVVKEFGIELTPGLGRLLDLINKNNATGSLKMSKYSIAHLMREMYELSEDLTQHVEIIVQATYVIQAFARVEDGEVMQPAEGLNEALPDLVEKFSVCHGAPMTLGRYIRDLWVLGETPVDIAARVAFWLNGWERLEREYARGKREAEKLSLKEWPVAGTAAVFLKTDDRFLVKSLIKGGRYGIRIIVASDGHTVISTSGGLDLSGAVKVLQRDEPGRWYFQERMGAIINGGPQYIGVEPTSITPDRLIKILQSRVQPKKKR